MPAAAVATASVNATPATALRRTATFRIGRAPPTPRRRHASRCASSGTCAGGDRDPSAPAGAEDPADHSPEDSLRRLGVQDLVERRLLGRSRRARRARRLLEQPLVLLL